jgi:hypothetical protein
MSPLVRRRAPLFLFLALLAGINESTQSEASALESHALEDAFAQRSVRQTSKDDPQQILPRARRATKRRLYKKDPPKGGNATDCDSVESLFNEIYSSNDTTTDGGIPALPCFRAAGFLEVDLPVAADPMLPTASPAPLIEIEPAPTFTFAPTDPGQSDIAPPGETGAPSTSPPPTPASSIVTTYIEVTYIEVSFYLALRPGRPAQPFLVSTVLTDLLNDTMPDRWTVFVEKNYTGSIGYRRHLADDEAEEDDEPLDLVLWYVDNSIQRRDDAAWWWMYTLAYFCYNSTTGEQVVEQEYLGQATSLTTEAVNSTHFFENLEKSALQPDLVGFATGELPPPGILPPADKDNGVLQPVDPWRWDARRWFGLGAFTFVVVGFALLSHIAAVRQKKRQRKQVWGHVGTVEGVDALLRTGWNVRGNRLEIYDRTGIGYRDDDSLFRGGYEQKEVIIGTAISLTQPESGTARTPDTERQS